MRDTISKAEEIQNLKVELTMLEHGAAAILEYDNETNTLHLSLPTVEDGVTPNLTIGTVQEGATAAATITGTKENPILNLTLPNANVPTKVSQLENDSGYLTTETDPTMPQWAKAVTKPSYTPQEVGALPADTYIPQKTSDLTNDSNYAADANYVHTDNNYTTEEKEKLSGIAAGAEVNVNADWNSTSGDAQILNKPTKVSDFTNDAGYLTTETDPTVPAWAKEPTKPAYTAAEVGAPTVAEMQQAIANVNTMKIHICAQAEYDVETGIPTIQNPDTQTFYLVPGGEGNNLFIEWAYVNDAWERFGSADVDLSAYATKADTVLETTLSRGRKTGSTIGAGSFAFGNGVEASSSYSFAQGSLTKATNTYSFAQGLSTIASGPYSHAEGNNTIAAGSSSHVSGKFNIEDNYMSYPIWTSGTHYFISDKVRKLTAIGSIEAWIYYECLEENTDTEFDDTKWKNHAAFSNYVEIIGNGIANNARSNAYALDWDGNGHYMGDIYVHANADSSGGVKLATVEDIPEAPVQDVQVNGVSVVSNGIANVLVANTNDETELSTLGVVKIAARGINGLRFNANMPGSLMIAAAGNNGVKQGADSYKPIVPVTQHAAAFYGLSKVAGVDLANETVTLGTYPETSKTAIKEMLGV